VVGARRAEQRGAHRRRAPMPHGRSISALTGSGAPRSDVAGEQLARVTARDGGGDDAWRGRGRPWTV
jgi:hypothetical protein